MNKNNNPPFKQWYRFRHNIRFRNHGILRDNTMLKFSNWWDTKVRQPYNRRFRRNDPWNPYVRAYENPNIPHEISYTDPYPFWDETQNTQQNTQQNMAFNQNNQYELDSMPDMLPPPDQDPNQVTDPNQMMNYGQPMNFYMNQYGGNTSGSTTSGSTINPMMNFMGGAVSVIQGIRQSRQAKKNADRARRQMKKERQQLREYENMYKNLDTSNPYMNMENTMEDLTINQKEAEFRRQQFEQSQANIMEGLRGAAGGSGIGALAQSLAQQGQIASQQAAADIGAQEAYNIRARADMAGQIQNMERQGDIYSRGLKERQTTTLMGMQERRALMREQELRNAQAMRQDAIGNIIGGVGQMGTSLFM